MATLAMLIPISLRPALQSRLGQLRLIRQSGTQVVIADQGPKTSEDEDEEVSEESAQDDEDEDEYESDAGVEDSVAAPATPPRPAVPPPADLAVVEANASLDVQVRPDGVDSEQDLRRSEVDWDYGRQGLRLLLWAEDESKTERQARKSSFFERKTYKDAIIWLLRGLPHSMTEHELGEIVEALDEPSGGRIILKQDLPDEPSDPANATSTASASASASASTSSSSSRSRSSTSSTSDPETPQPLIYHVVHLLIIQACLLVRVMIPHLLRLARWLAALERRHCVSERLTRRGVVCAGAAGRYGARLGMAAMRCGVLVCGNDRLGELLVGVMESATRGVVDGAGDGVGILLGQGRAAG